MARRTKIIATIGPACDTDAGIKSLIEAGMDVARLALAHGSLESNLERFEAVRRAAADYDRPIGILVDLPGPKIRAGSFPEEGAVLHEGAPIRLRAGEGDSTAEVIEIDYADFASDVHVGDNLGLADGQVTLRVVERDVDGLLTEVVHGGLLKGRPGVHVPAEHLRLKTPTEEDLRLLDAFVDVGVDFVALSFVRSAHDVRKIGTEPHPRGPLVVAKIETRAAIDNLDGIVEASGAIMVARGDLGAECDIEALPHLQKEVIRRCIALGRPVITATQMLESMVTAPTPTRAEASDVANAVFDGSSVVMLSAETAIGHDPANAVRVMAAIAERADELFDYSVWAEKLTKLDLQAGRDEKPNITDAMTGAAWRAAAEVNPAAIICLTRTGFTVRSIARFRPHSKILGFSENDRTVRQLTMSWGATPIHMTRTGSWEDDARRAMEAAVAQGEIRSGELVAVLAGSDDLPSGMTDSLRLTRAP